MRNLLANQRLGQYTDNAATVFENRIGKYPHQADIGAAVDDLELSRRELASEVPNHLSVGALRPWARTCKDTHSSHRRVLLAVQDHGVSRERLRIPPAAVACKRDRGVPSKTGAPPGLFRAWRDVALPR